MRNILIVSLSRQNDKELLGNLLIVSLSEHVKTKITTNYVEFDDIRITHLF